MHVKPHRAFDRIQCPVNVDTHSHWHSVHGRARVRILVRDHVKEIREFWQTGSSYEPQSVSEETKQCYRRWKKAIIATVQYSCKI